MKLYDMINGIYKNKKELIDFNLLTFDNRELSGTIELGDRTIGDRTSIKFWLKHKPFMLKMNWNTYMVIIGHGRSNYLKLLVNNSDIYIKQNDMKLSADRILDLVSDIFSNLNKKCQSERNNRKHDRLLWESIANELRKIK